MDILKKGVALYVLGRRLTNVKVEAVSVIRHDSLVAEEKTKGAPAPFARVERLVPIWHVLAGYARDLRRSLAIDDVINWYINVAAIASVFSLRCRHHLDHLAGAFEQGAGFND